MASVCGMQQWHNGQNKPDTVQPRPSGKHTGPYHAWDLSLEQAALLYSIFSLAFFLQTRGVGWNGGGWRELLEEARCASQPKWPLFSLHKVSSNTKEDALAILRQWTAGKIKSAI